MKALRDVEIHSLDGSGLVFNNRTNERMKE